MKRFLKLSGSLGSKTVIALLIVALTLTSGIVSSRQAQAQDDETAKPRVIMTSDGEADDINSFIRFLLYSNEFDIEGLVYSSSQWHYAGDGLGTLFTSEIESTAERYGERTDLRWAGTEWIDFYLYMYADIYDNLIQHKPDYPSPEYLQSLVKVGNINFEGDMAAPSEGSDWIKDILLDDDPGPVYVMIWGGTNTFARALKSIEEEYAGTDEWDAIYQKVSEKAVIFTILDQDATYQNYIAPNWPDVKVYYDSAQFWSFAYAWPRAVPAELQTYLNGDWFAEHVKLNHGDLLAHYFTWGDGLRLAGDTEYTRWNPQVAADSERMRYDFVSEGDSPSFMHLLDVGLRNIDDPSFGGWGGRLIQSEENPNRWEDGEAVVDFNPYTGEADTSYPLVRWIDAIQNDFAARTDWAVMSYDEANHEPAVTIDGELDLTAAPGGTVSLSGLASDPDGDDVSLTWWQYQEAGSYAGAVELSATDGATTSFVVPEDAQAGDTIHIILAGTDSGEPPLTRYQRVIVTVG
ncbi:MAG TPA: DUF1593 domain-containing protein [Aggregatilinea sp.]|uniref:DUF1593 domain-containing protein n=1 Tax=Aggregatilinea sp. TaxID=2806333 RepID=UPI002CDA9CA3|nr:nucleoside hydrolase-like domain-containing protein [Aggregatilinea sp.]HML21740.1 DUF1593 domain-containing protein [Aggregatilinea sp.]